MFTSKIHNDRIVSSNNTKDFTPSKPSKRKTPHQAPRAPSNQNLDKPLSVSKVMTSVLEYIPNLLKKFNTQEMKKLLSNNDPQEFVWVIRYKYIPTYYSVLDSSYHPCLVAFHKDDECLAKSTLHAIKDYNLYTSSKIVYKKPHQPMILEKLPLMFIQDVCDATSLNLIVYYKDTHEDKIKSRQFWFPKTPSKDVRFSLENIFKHF